MAENIDRIARYTRGYDADRFTSDDECQDAGLGSATAGPLKLIRA